MPPKQGELALLNEPVAQELLQSMIPARLAYCGRDDTPRVLPIWFHWTGDVFVLGTRMDAPKVKALSANLERKRTTCAYRQARLQTVLDHGLPEGISWEQLQALLEVPAHTSPEEKVN